MRLYYNGLYKFKTETLPLSIFFDKPCLWMVICNVLNGEIMHED
jgi:hypothetical protein